MADIRDRAREYLAKHSEYSEVFGQTFVAVDTLTAMVEFAEQEIKTKWHDLRKDPTDVPQNKRNVWCITSDGGKEGFYDKERMTPWVIGNSCWSTIDAWCELPKWEN